MSSADPVTKYDTVFFRHINDHLIEMEGSYRLATRQDYLNSLRALGLGDFGYVLWNMPHTAFPKLSAGLPPMTSKEVTIAWTGAEGTVLLDQAMSFVRACSDKYAEITGVSLKNKSILDFGCGYGRYLRLFKYYSDEVYGVDAWDASLEHSRNAGFERDVKKVDEVPQFIPFFREFDFIFSFSVFTHLSMTSTIAALKALRKAAKPGAVLVITIRPIEFWNACVYGGTHLSLSEEEAAQFVAQHDSSGFAYIPNGSDLPPDQVHYGDTSLSLAWLAQHAEGWQVHSCDRSTNDQLQIYVALEAV